MMHTRAALAAALLLVLDSVRPTGAHQLSPRDPADKS